MIRFILKIYTVLVTIDALLSFFPKLHSYAWRLNIKRISDYTCNPVRRFLPTGLPFDFSPIIVIFSIYIFIEIFSYLW